MLKKINNPLVILFFMSVVMIISWFRYGYLYGGGDVGLPTYDPIRLLNVVKNIWWDVHAPGFPYLTALTAIPFYSILAFLQTLGLSNIFIQALTFGSLLFLTGAGMYLLFFEVTGLKSKTLSFIAALFYMLNPYMVTQVWHRFVHTAFFLAALIPILMFIYIKIVKTHSLLWFVSFLGISFVFSYTYGSLPFMIVMWIPLFIYSLWKKNILTFLLTLIFWLVSNTWWLYPFWTTGPAILVEMHSTYASISTLLSLSAQSTSPMILRGISAFYTFGDNAWVPGYDLFFMQIISWTLPLVILIGIYSILVHKRKDFYIWILLLLIGIFISKGTAAPFGYPFLWFFSKSFFLGAFRNPFEKLGIIVPFASAFIFPLGIQKIFLWLRDKFSGKKYLPIGLISILLFLQFGVYSWPMWTGKIFGSLEQSAFVEIPDSYKKADQWIQAQGKQGRILQLPFATGDAITYFWSNGYNGIEPSSLLFKTPSVSQGFGLNLLDSDLGAINTAFTTENFDKNEVENVLSSLNIRYIVVHKDVDWKARKLVDPEKLIDLLSRVDSVSKKVVFGDLIIYQVDDNFFTSKVFTTNVSDVLTGNDKGFALWPEIYADKKLPEVFTTPINGNDNSLSLQTGLNYSVTPSRIIGIPPYPLAYKENALAELPKPHFLPDSPFYFLILLKEKIQLFSSPILNHHLFELDLAGKRLSEMYLLTQKGNTKLAETMRKKYINELNIALDLVNQKRESGLMEEDEVLGLKSVFARHEIILEELNDKGDLESLKMKLSEMGFIPYYDLKEDGGMNKYGREVYRFDVPKEGDYEILLRDTKSRTLYQNNLDRISIQVNDIVKTLNVHENRGFLSLGTIKLNKGLNEISYNTTDSINLIPESGSDKWVTSGSVNTLTDNGKVSYEISTDKLSNSSLSFPITGFDNNSLYRIDFEFWIKSGQGPILQAEQNSDWYKKDERVMSIDTQYDKDNYNFYWTPAFILFQPRANTKDAMIRFLVKPWNNCFDILNNRKLCLNENVAKIYNRESDVVIGNISVKRLFTNDMLLLSPNKNETVAKLANVDIIQISPSYYEGNLTLSDPTSLVLLTTFHPEWKLSLIKDGKTEIVSEDRHFLANGYGNLWYLNEEPGQYKIKIEFLPQQRFNKGVVVSAIGTTILIGVVFVYSRKKKKWLN